MNLTNFRSYQTTFVFAFIAVFSFASIVPAQKGSDGRGDATYVIRTLEGGGVVVSGNPTCATLNASNDPTFAHITEDWGLKLDFTPPDGMSGPYPFTSGSGRVLTGGASPEPTNSVAINRSGNTFDFTSTRSITAVIVKGGPDGNVYVYPSQALADQGLTTPGSGSFGISHIEFCFESTGGATAAPASVGGRVMSSVGRPIYGADVTLTDVVSGETRVVRTNTYGYYTFENVETARPYILSVASKKYRFSNDAQYFTLNQDSFGFDFTSN